MKMTFRWYGEKEDNIPLSYIKQIPGVDGVVTAIYDVPVGEVWPLKKVQRLKSVVEKANLSMEVIESVNVHEDIKLGLPTRDQYIENYKDTLKNLQKVGVKVVCYNFMPVFDWTRSALAKVLPDGSTALSYDQNVIDKITDLQQFVDEIAHHSNGFEMPGWEKERLGVLKDLFTKYKNVTNEDLFRNLQYFLEKIMPTCEGCDIKMAMHPDDPPWGIFGLPRITTCKESLERIVSLVDTPYNGLTLCSGSLGASEKNDIPALIRHFGEQKRIHFGHVRNVKIHAPGQFDEAAHLSSEGSLDLYEIMKAYHDVDFNGYIRPDHGRMIWGEIGRPGYGLYDRALGIAYLNGLWEAIKKAKK